jgi:hypothetical protein
MSIKLPTIALGATWVVRAIGSTLRVNFVNPEVEEEARRIGKGRLIYAFWHSRMVVPAFTHRGRGIGVLSSEHRDGEIMSRTLVRLGFQSVRGSTTRGGAEGLRGLMSLPAECDLAITPDGPRGPRWVAKPGIVFLAGSLGIPILPAGILVRPAWQLRSWDRFLLPKPFARAVVVFGEPIVVPGIPASDEERDRLAGVLQARLLAAEKEAAARLGLAAVPGAPEG